MPARADRDGPLDEAGDDRSLERFVTAQARCYATVIRELRAGAKQSHWIWYIFPQYHGLGHSETSRRFSIVSLAEAREYLEHPVLGPRLRECTALTLAVPRRSAREIFGPDDVKVRSSMTLFEVIGGPASPFAALLDRKFGGIRDARTLDLICADQRGVGDPAA